MQSVSPAPALHCRVAHAIVQKSARVSSVQVDHTDEGQQRSGGGDVRREQATQKETLEAKLEAKKAVRMNATIKEACAIPTAHKRNHWFP